MNNKPKIEISRLKKQAIEYKDSLNLNETELRKIDQTNDFNYELKAMLKHKEIINIQILGEVTTGKSTVMMKLVQTINNHLKQKTTLQDIAVDQIEFSRKVSNNKLQNKCIGIDEWNELSTTGANATVETAYLKAFSEMQAQRNIHRIGCSPSTVIDPNANIILNIEGKDTDLAITRCTINYKFPTTGYKQLIGYVDIFVGDILNTKWYKQYRKRKFKKFELMNEQGISDPRKIEFASIIKETYYKLEKLTTTNIITRDLVSTVQAGIIDQKKKYLSIIADEMLLKDAYGLLTMKKAIHRLRQQEIKAREKVQELELKDQKLYTTNWQEIADTTEQARLDAQRILDERLKRYEQLEQIDEEYQKI